MGEGSGQAVRYIAFLRAINVGGHNVKMADLRQLFEELGLASVETFIASGNVIFESADDPATLESQIADHLRQALGYPVATFLRSSAELAAIAAYQPFSIADLAGDNSTLYIGFLPQPPGEAAAQKLLAWRTPTDAFHIHDRELYWLCRTRISDSPITGAQLEKLLGLPATLRNSTTVQKLAAKYASA